MGGGDGVGMKKVISPSNQNKQHHSAFLGPVYPGLQLVRA